MGQPYAIGSTAENGSGPPGGYRQYLAVGQPRGIVMLLADDAWPSEGHRQHLVVANGSAALELLQAAWAVGSMSFASSMLVETPLSGDGGPFRGHQQRLPIKCLAILRYSTL